MIEQDGLEKTSLLRIAEKTGFAPPTVYAYFVRQRIVSAIVADDLSSFAKTIRDGFPFSPEPELAENDIGPSEIAYTAEHAQIRYDAEDAEHAEHEPHPVEAVEAHAPVVAESHSEDDHGTAAAPAESASADGLIFDHRNPHRAAGSAPRRSVAGSPLREFERMLSTLDERVGGSQTPVADGNADNRLQQIVERLEAFEKKQAAAVEEKAKVLAETIEAREAKLRQTQAELRTLTLEASGRLEVLERDREMRAMATEMPAVDFTPHAEPAPAVEPIAEAVAMEEHEDAPPSSDESRSRRRAPCRADRAVAGERGREELRGRSLGLGRAWTHADPYRSVRRHRCRSPGSQFLLHRAATPAAARTPATQTAKLLPSTKGLHGSDFASINAAAQSGSDRAQLELGLIYLNGAGVAEDDARAAHWLQSSAASGDAVAQYWLATLFEHGKGERADAAEAIRWYEASALQGNLKAMYKLAVSYAEGWGTRQNYGEAARWFSRAGEYGFVNAQYNLGVLYERGFGVPQSLLELLQVVWAGGGAGRQRFRCTRRCLVFAAERGRSRDGQRCGRSVQTAGA